MFDYAWLLILVIPMAGTVPVGEMETLQDCKAAGLEMKQMEVVTADPNFNLKDSEYFFVCAPAPYYRGTNAYD